MGPWQCGSSAPAQFRWERPCGWCPACGSSASSLLASSAAVWFDGFVVQVLIHALQTAELLHPGQGQSFSPMPGTPGILSEASPIRLHFRSAGGGPRRIFPDGGGVHGQRFAVGGKQHRGGIVYQLQAVPSPGRQQVVPPAASLAAASVPRISSASQPGFC